MNPEPAEPLEKDQRTLRREADSSTPRILILRVGASGDTLMVSPLVRALRQTFPNAYLAFLCSRSARDVIRHNPHLDEVISIAYRHLPPWLSPEKQGVLSRLRAMKLDWALALESHPHFVQMACRVHPARVIAYGGLPQGEGFEQADWDRGKHSIENHLRAARSLGVEPKGLEMELHYPSDLDASLRQRLERQGAREGKLLVGVHAGWGGCKHRLNTTRLRSWPPENFAAVIRWLVERAGTGVVLTGSRADSPLMEFIARLSRVPCCNLAGRLSWLEMAALIRRLNLYLTVDSGPAHLAAALGTPLITLWGPAIYEQTAPLPGRGPVRILYHRVHCAPCYGTPLMKSCQDNICMKQIEVTEVQEAISQLLASLKPGPNYSGSTLASSTSIIGMSSLMG